MIILIYIIFDLLNPIKCLLLKKQKELLIRLFPKITLNIFIRKKAILNINIILLNLSSKIPNMFNIQKIRNIFQRLNQQLTSLLPFTLQHKQFQRHTIKLGWAIG